MPEEIINIAVIFSYPDSSDGKNKSFKKGVILYYVDDLRNIKK